MHSLLALVHLYWYMVNVCRESQRQTFHRHRHRMSISAGFEPKSHMLSSLCTAAIYFIHIHFPFFRSRRSMTWRARWGWSGSGGSWETLACDGRAERSHKEVSDTHIFLGQLVSRCYFPHIDTRIWQLCLTRTPEQVEQSLECPLDAELICTHISQI